MRLNPKLTVFFLILTLTGCVTTGGLIETRYPDGTLKTEQNFEDGKANGTYREYYPTGVFNVTAYYHNDQLDGLKLIYREDGTLETATEYVHDKIHGFHNYYYPNESLWKKEIYVAGKLVKRIEYDEEGFVIQEENFNDIR